MLRLGKASTNGSSANIKLSKIQLHKVGHPGGFLGKLLKLLVKTRLPLIKNVLKPLVKSILIPLVLTAATSATDAAIHRKMFGYGNTKLIISKKEMNNIMDIIHSLEESGLLINGVSQTIKNKAKEQKGRFLGKLLGTLEVKQVKE